MRCPNCGTNNPAEEQLTYCGSCGAELRVVCPRCSADNPAFEEFCRECNLELHPDRGHERAAGIRGRDLVNDEEPWLSRHGQLLVGGLVVAAILWLPVAYTLRQRSQFNTCQQHLGKIAIALQLYQRDNDDTMPAAENWTPVLLPYLKDSSYLKCPARSERIGYAFNSYLSMQKFTLQPGSDAIAFFEAKGGTANLSGDDTSWINSPIHSRGNNVALLSGAVKVLRQSPGLNYWVLTGTTPPPAAAQPPKSDDKTDEPATGALPQQPSGAPTVPAPVAPTSAPPVAPTSAPPSVPPASPDVAPGALPANPPMPPQPQMPAAIGQTPSPTSSP